ncbi:MAG: DNA repair protein RecO, partial [Rickettsiales bacterium]|nr:DNA repair protein RecO [Rickettsiales bacterium]
MKIESNGIIVALRPFGNRDMVGRVFTREHGLVAGVFKAGQVAKRRALLGQYGRASWSARLDSQLGALHFENERNLTAAIFNNAAALKYANACLELLAAFLPEREAYPKLFDATMKYFSGGDYLEWEIKLLAELGYGLSLDRCGGCGRTDGLAFVSPKTGRAVCEECGAPYADKLLKGPV